MRYLPSLLRVQILSNDGICLGANINKFDQMWYLLHICIDFAVVVNPFFRAVLWHLIIVNLCFVYFFINKDYHLPMPGISLISTWDCKAVFEGWCKKNREFFFHCLLDLLFTASNHEFTSILYCQVASSKNNVDYYYYYIWLRSER